MLHLENILHSRGFSITIILNNFNSPEPSNYPHFTFHLISENLPQNGTCATDIIAFLMLLNATCVSPFRNCLANLLSDTSEEPIACLISDATQYLTQDVANELKLPRMVLKDWCCLLFLCFHCFSSSKGKRVHSHTRTQIRFQCSIQLFDSIRLTTPRVNLNANSQLEEAVVELPPLRVKDLPVIHTSDPEDLYRVVNGMVNHSKASSGMIWNTFQELEQSALETLHQELGVPLFPIGPFHKSFPLSSSSLLTQDQSCISWLDKQGHNQLSMLALEVLQQ
ncbi:hypothetical protein PTKIN_Ptkin17bG0055300 [Pterospermum kingtungense]